MTTPTNTPPTCDEPPAGELRTDEALRLILQAVTAIEESSTVPLEEAGGRVLAENIHSPIDVPGHTNSAVDGYALRSADLPAGVPAILEVAGHALAGHPFPGDVGPGECVAITTGAALPAGADTVVMQEYTEKTGSAIRLTRPCRRGENVRRAGEDIRRGGSVAGRGTAVSPALLGVLASLGLDGVNVLRRPRVAVFSTGDEVQAPGTPLQPGGVYDSNRFTLRGMLDGVGADILDLGLVPDAPDRLRSALAEAAAASDAVVTSGGVSVGEADYIKPILAELGQADFWKLAIKPGRPLTFGRLGKTLFFGLPGNPVAVMVTFLQFVRPALQQLAGMTPAALPKLRARCHDSLRKRPGRREFQRGIAAPAADGQLHVRLTGRQGSGILTSMSQANCLIVLPESQGNVEAGDIVDVELLPWAIGQGGPF